MTPSAAAPPAVAAAGTAARSALTATLSCLLLALFVFHRQYRGLESMLASQVVAALAHTHTSALPARAVVYFDLGSKDALGLQITPECTSAFLVAPLLVVAIVMVRLRPYIARRVLTALGLASVMLVATNQLRIAMVVWLVQWLGTDRGYYWGHTLLGSAVSVVGGAVSLATFVWYVSGRRPPKPVGRHRRLA